VISLTIPPLRRHRTGRAAMTPPLRYRVVARGARGLQRAGNPNVSANPNVSGSDKIAGEARFPKKMYEF